MRTKSSDTYVRRLKKKIESKFGSYDDSLDEQVETAAMNRVMINTIHKELMDGSLTTIAVGSMGQQKTEINPLLAAYDKAQRTYTQQLAALGLNKMAEKKAEATTKVETAETNPFLQLQKSMQQ